MSVLSSEEAKRLDRFTTMWLSDELHRIVVLFGQAPASGYENLPAFPVGAELGGKPQPLTVANMIVDLGFSTTFLQKSFRFNLSPTPTPAGQSLDKYFERKFPAQVEVGEPRTIVVLKALCAMPGTRTIYVAAFGPSVHDTVQNALHSLKRQSHGVRWETTLGKTYFAADEIGDGPLGLHNICFIQLPHQSGANETRLSKNEAARPRLMTWFNAVERGTRPNQSTKPLPQP